MTHTQDSLARLGAVHKDLHLQAQASHVLGGLQAMWDPAG